MTNIELLTAYRQEMHKIQIKNGFTDEQMTSYRQGFMDAIREYEQRIAADVQSVNQWISCKDEMPEDGISVLICSYRGTVSKATYDSDMGYFYIADSELHYNELDITHWQPLPKAPVNE